MLSNCVDINMAIDHCFRAALPQMAGQNNSALSRCLMSLEFQSQNILRAVALFEIMLMPYTIVMLFT